MKRVLSFLLLLVLIFSLLPVHAFGEELLDLMVFLGDDAQSCVYKPAGGAVRQRLQPV